MGILLVVMRLGVSGLKNFMLVYTQGLFEERGEKGWCDLVCVECLWVMIGLIVHGMGAIWVSNGGH